MIISVLNEKGGVGKTTLSTALAHALVLRSGHDVLLVDADPQGSVLRWAERRKMDLELPFRIMGLPTKTLDRDLEPYLSHHDHIVIDGPPRSDEIAEACLRAADFVLIPCTPSYYDVWATEQTIALLARVRVARGYNAPSACMILNRVREGTLIEREVFTALQAFPDVPTMDTRMHERTIHQLVTRTGQTVFENDRRSLAAAEAEAAVNEVLERAYTTQDGVL